MGDCKWEMPRYKCHKEVSAVKITAIHHFEKFIGQSIKSGDASHGARIMFEDGGIEVSADYITKHNPQEGGYYVVYEDGYQSFSPAEAFESGYALLTSEQKIVLEDNEQYRMQMAGISCASMGGWKEGDRIHPDYMTNSLNDVAALYTKYDSKYKLADQMADALKGVIRVADRATVEFDAARSCLEAYEAQKPV